MRYWIFIILTGLLAGCLENDVPLPVIYGNVQKIEFEGQQKVVINTKTRTIELTLNDSVNIRKIRLKDLELSADAARPQEVFVTPKATIEVDSVFDLSEKLVFWVNTYQSYEWTVVTEQPIERYFTVENQVGEAMINAGQKRVMVVVEDGQDLENILVSDVKLGVVSSIYIPDPETLTDFSKMQIIKVVSYGDTVEWKVRINHPVEETSAVTVNAWAKFADFQGKISSGQSGTPAFEYKRSNSNKWTRIEANVEGNTFSAKATGLRPQTDYLIRPVFGEEPGKEETFKTEAAEQVPYSNFDSWYMVGDAPCVGNGGPDSLWDSGNKGGASVKVIPTTEEKTNVIKGSAVKLASKYVNAVVVKKFASGSLYTGQFGGMNGMTNVYLNFGIPYSCRPTTLSGYYQYQPKSVDIVNNGYDYLKGKPDSCHIYIALTDWSTPFKMDSEKLDYVDLSRKNTSIIAFGELKTDRWMDNYEKFTIQLEYRDMTRKPTYILIVASSSKYGDYFTGGDGSTLWIDEFELGFD